MPWDEIAKRLSAIISEMLDDIYQDIIDNAEENPDDVLELSDDEVSLVEDAVSEAIADLSEEVISDFPQEVSEEFEFGLEEGAFLFFILKQLTDGINSVHGASVAHQILPADRAEAASLALERAKGRILSAADSESSASFALKHEELAIDSGFTYFRYHTSEDDVVRPEHVRRNQMVFRYGSERVADDVPGLANACRCFAEPLELDEAVSGTFFYPEDSPIGIQARTKVEKMKRKFKIHADSSSAITVDIIGAIDYWMPNDYVTFAERVTSFIDNDGQTVELNITSFGGNGDASMDAHDFLKALPNRVVANIYGYAGSAATHFAVAADHTTIGEKDEFFIHQAFTCPCGNKGELLEIVERLTEFDEKQISAYVDKTGMGRDDIEDLLNAERVISADQAKEFGFVDEIRPDSNRSRTARGEPVAQATHSALIQAHQPTSIKKVKTMKLEDIINALASDAELKAKLLKKLDGSAEQTDDKGDTALAALQAEVASLKTDVAAKDSIINAATQAATNSGEESEPTAAELRETIRAELVQEGEAKTLISAEVIAAGLEVNGEIADEILASAIEQAGGSVAAPDGKAFDTQTLNSVWASIKTFRNASSNAAEINALGSGTTKTGAVEDVAHLEGSRADRINK